MKRITIILFFLSIQLSFGNDNVWSKTGHRTIGEVAQSNLSRKTRKAIDKLLNGQRLAQVSTFGDDIKADRDFKEFNPWHYVNFPHDKKYTDGVPSEQGDLVIGIQKCIAVVKDKHSSNADRVFYLKLLVHLIGDLHQPMHVGRKEDKGGNDIQLLWFNNGTNLHKVWDANMINGHGMSYTELAESLPKLNKKQKKKIQEGDVYDWVEESQELANKIYGSVEMGEKLYFRYSYVWWATVEKQLQKGGLRLAKVLNEIFE